MKTAMMSYARNHDFDIGDNGCLQIFIARHTHLSARAVELLQRSLYIFMYTTMNVQAFCTPFIPMGDLKEPENESARMLEALGSGLEHLGELQLNKTLAWSCEDYTPTKATTVSPSKAPTVAPSKSSGAQRSTTIASVNITSMPDSGKWREEAQEVAKNTIGAISKHIGANTWEKRCKQLHPAVTEALNKNLTDKFENFPKKNTNFNSVALLTYDDNGKSCMRYDDYSVYGTLEHVTYLAQPFGGAGFKDKLASNKKALLAREQDILDKTFSSPSDDLCKTAANVLEDVLGLVVKETASAFVVVRCGYKFVWYQLGYEYFPAANSTSPYALTTRQNNVYSANCGQFILFP